MKVKLTNIQKPLSTWRHDLVLISRMKSPTRWYSWSHRVRILLAISHYFAQHLESSTIRRYGNCRLTMIIKRCLWLFFLLGFIEYLQECIVQIPSSSTDVPNIWQRDQKICWSVLRTQRKYIYIYIYIVLYVAMLMVWNWRWIYVSFRYRRLSILRDSG